MFRPAREKDLAASRIKESQPPESIDRLNLGTHPDLVERFWKGITTLLPEPCCWVVYGSPVLVHPRTGILFGWAGGTHAYALRCPEEARRPGALRVQRYRYAKTTDTMDLASLGPDWVFGDWAKGEEVWCLKAYENAGTY